MYENAWIIIVGLWFVPLCLFVTLLFLAVCSGPSISGSDERGAEAALPPSTPANAVAVSNSVVGAKLGDGQALRVRLDSYPAGKWYLFHFCIKNWILSSKHFCRIRTKQDLNTSWTEGNNILLLQDTPPFPYEILALYQSQPFLGNISVLHVFYFACFLLEQCYCHCDRICQCDPPYHPPPLTFNWLNIHPIRLLLIGVTKKKLSYFCLQRTTCITQENEARNLNTSIRSQMIFGILEHMKLKS